MALPGQPGLPPTDLTGLSGLTPSGIVPKRVKLQLMFNDEIQQSKLLIVPETLEGLADLARAAFKIDRLDRIHFRVDDADVDGIDVLRDGDVLNVYQDTQYQMLCKKLTTVGSTTASSAAAQAAAAAAAATTNPFALYYPPPFVSTNPSALTPSLATAFNTACKRGSMSMMDSYLMGSTNSSYGLNYSRIVPKRQRYRRTHKELAREWKCEFAECDRMYASENSMIQHQRIKHPGFVTHEPKGRGRPPSKPPKTAAELLGRDVVLGGNSNDNSENHTDRKMDTVVHEMDNVNIEMKEGEREGHGKGQEEREDRVEASEVIEQGVKQKEGGREDGV